MLRKQKPSDVIRAFEKAGAIDAESASDLHSLGLHRIGPAEDLIRQGVLRSDAPTRYYLDRKRLEQAKQLRYRLYLWGFVVLSAVYAAYLIASLRLL